MEEADLVRRAQRGDTRAFGRLVETHQARIYATLVRIVGDRDRALDLSQDAFLRAWERLDRFELRASFSTWLHRIAVRLAYDAVARDGREIPLDDAPPLADDGPATDARALAADGAADLRRRIDGLPPLQRAVVVLRAYDRLPYREIAEILGTTETSARVSFHHAVRRLKRDLEEASR